jgi:hypothetical protein
MGVPGSIVCPEVEGMWGAIIGRARFSRGVETSANQSATGIMPASSDSAAINAAGDSQATLQMPSHLWGSIGRPVDQSADSLSTSSRLGHIGELEQLLLGNLASPRYRRHRR